MIDRKKVMLCSIWISAMIARSVAVPRKILTRNLKQVSGTTYTIQNVERSAMNCPGFLSVSGCRQVEFASEDDGSGSQRFEFRQQDGGWVIANVNCAAHLSVSACSEADALYLTPDSTGTGNSDIFYFNSIGNDIVNIDNNRARSGCSQVLSSSACQNIAFVSGDSGSGGEKWMLTSAETTMPAAAESSPESSAESSPISSLAKSTDASPPIFMTSSSPAESTIESTNDTPSPSIAANENSIKKGIVYDFFFQYCSAVLQTSSKWWTNFDAGYDAACTDPKVIKKHIPMIWGTDRIQSAYSTIMNRPDYAKPKYVMTFNEPNYAYDGGSPSNIATPKEAAALWPQITSLFAPLQIELIAPSPIDCSGNRFCRNQESMQEWLDSFRTALSESDWNAIHALNVHTYATDFQNIVSELTTIHEKYGKPIWIGEIAAGSSSSMQNNIDLMHRFVPWAESTSWIERYFWNQATRPSNPDPNIDNSYMIDKAEDGTGDGQLTSEGEAYAFL